MPAKGEKPEAPPSPSARVLRKARSFRDDLRSRIARHAAAQTHNAPRSVPASPQHQRAALMRHRRRTLSRGNSCGESHHQVEPVKESDVEKLEHESRRVFQSLSYVEQVVSKGVLELLPGSVTVVLETIMELNQQLSKHFVEQESSAMVSTYNQVYQGLANMVRWADRILLRRDAHPSVTAAADVISSLRNGIKELLRLSMDKLNNMHKYHTLHSAQSTTRNSATERTQRSSLPDIPLTPREKKILEETAACPAGYANGISLVPPLTNGGAGGAPPKPPRPVQLDPMLAKSIAGQMFFGPDSDDVDGMMSLPPPLPIKRRGRHASLSPSGPASPRTMTPASMSPSSSVTSGFSTVSESSSGGVAGGVAGGGASSISRLSQYDNFGTAATATASADVVDGTNQRLVCNTLPPDGADVLPPLPIKRGSGLAGPTVAPPGAIVAQAVQQNAMTTAHGLVSASRTTTASATCSFRTALLASSCTTTMHVTVSRETFSSSETFSSLDTGNYSSSGESLQIPPPLPPKKRPVEAYMQMLGHYTSPTLHELTRHSIHSMNFYQSQWHRHEMELFQPLNTPPTRSMTLSAMSQLTSGTVTLDEFAFTATSATSGGATGGATGQPAIRPPQQAQKGLLASSLPMLQSHTQDPTPRTLVNPDVTRSPAIVTDSIRPTGAAAVVSQGTTRPPATTSEPHAPSKPPLPSLSSIRATSPVANRTPAFPPTNSSTSPQSPANQSGSPQSDVQTDADSDFAELTTLDDIDVTDQLVKGKTGDELEIRGGSIDALIVHATTAAKHDFMYQEAFLTTYRTFIKPQALIDKLLYRYHRFSRINDVMRKKLSRNAFSFLIRTVDELCMELNEPILETLSELVSQLLCDGELMLAKILRKKVLEKSEWRRVVETRSRRLLLPSYQLSVKPYCITDFKSEQIAEQMTLLDAELFQAIEIPEVLLWSKEQNDEQSQNLARFTEHFNKMSYWCRTQILEREDPKERERYFIKFIKIMKHMKKFNNFNSYLAILSAVDSAPIRRLDWQKQGMETLRDFCQLIDSSSSFRAYRQALAETEAPCIPYIGLVLQDLTFVHIGNSETFSDGNINFAKRWQQFHILGNIKRFKKCNFDFKKNQKIISCFNNFDNYLSEDSLWQISEMIKPRPSSAAKKRSANT